MDEETVGVCPVCAKKNNFKRVVLRMYNCTEGIYTCEDNHCTYHVMNGSCILKYDMWPELLPLIANTIGYDRCSNNDEMTINTELFAIEHAFDKDKVVDDLSEYVRFKENSNNSNINNNNNNLKEKINKSGEEKNSISEIDDLLVNCERIIDQTVELLSKDEFVIENKEVGNYVHVNDNNNTIIDNNNIITLESNNNSGANFNYLKDNDIEELHSILKSYSDNDATNDGNANGDRCFEYNFGLHDAGTMDFFDLTNELM